MKLLVTITSLVLIAATSVGCRSVQSTKPAVVDTVRAKVVESRHEQVPVVVKSTGTLHARQSATLSAQPVGRVQHVLVHAGDQVRASETLVTLDDAALKSAADQAEAAVKSAESQQVASQASADLAASTLARYKQLQAQKSVSPQEMDEVTRRAEAATAQVDALRAQADALKAQQSGARTALSYTRITAPFSGVVTTRMADPGALASPGVPLLQIDSTGPLQLQTTVPESAIASVHRGMTLNVSIDGIRNGDPAGTVSEVSPAAEASSRSFLVKIDLPPSNELRVGMYATADFPTGMKQAIVAPRSAIVLRGSLPCAYVVDGNGMAQLRYLTLGALHGTSVEILSGITAGEKLIDDPADRDLAGKRIEVQP